MNILDANEIDETGDESTAILRREDNIRMLIFPFNAPPKIDSPDIFVLLLKTELRIGDPHLCRPPLAVYTDFPLPDTVPRIITPFIIV